MASQYTQMEWVGSSSSPSDSYINLNYSITDHTKIVAKIAFNGYTSTNGIIFGTDNKDLIGSLGLMSYNSYGRIYYDYGGTDRRIYFDGLYPSLTPVTLELGNRYIKINSELKVSSSAVAFVTSQQPLYILGGKNLRSWNCQNRIYEFRIYEDDNLMMELLPARKKGTNIYGFYDTKTKIFFENDATGLLTCGKELQDIVSDDGSYTDILGLQIDFQKQDPIHLFINSFDVNSRKIDYSHTPLKNKNQSLVTGLNAVDQQFLVDVAQKEIIQNALDNKVVIDPTKDAVSNNLISKLNKDYPRDTLDYDFATLDEYNQLVESTCATVMKNYYTAEEVDALVDKGSGSKMEGYYTKAEIDILIPEKEDLTKVQNFLDAQTEYINDLAIFTKLNGDTN